MPKAVVCVGLFDGNLLVFEGYDHTWIDFVAAAGFGLSVHLDHACINYIVGVSTGFYPTQQFE